MWKHIEPQQNTPKQALAPAQHHLCTCSAKNWTPSHTSIGSSSTHPASTHMCCFCICRFSLGTWATTTTGRNNPASFSCFSLWSVLLKPVSLAALFKFRVSGTCVRLCSLYVSFCNGQLVCGHNSCFIPAFHAWVCPLLPHQKPLGVVLL